MLVFPPGELQTIPSFGCSLNLSKAVKALPGPAGAALYARGPAPSSRCRTRTRLQTPTPNTWKRIPKLFTLFPQNRYRRVCGCAWESTTYPCSACTYKYKCSRSLPQLYQLQPFPRDTFRLSEEGQNCKGTVKPLLGSQEASNIANSGISNWFLMHIVQKPVSTPGGD